MARLIDADALMEDLKQEHDWLIKLYEGLQFYDDKRQCSAEIAAFNEIIMRIKKAPTIEAEPVRHGEWIDGQPYTNSHWRVCSVCHKSADHPAGGHEYCGHCGAKMDGGENDP